MAIPLAPDVEAAVTRLVASGAYQTPIDVVAAAVRLLETERDRQQDELRALIREGVESAERGELYDGDEVFDEILRDLDASTRSE
jgi:antitoxin ParD1/3/4